MPPAPASTAWSEEYALGLPQIDDQHKFLFELIDEVWRAIASRSDRETLLRVVGALEEYTISHFGAEEAFMREHLYSRYFEHKAEHEKFVSRIAHEKAAVTAGRQLSLDLLHFLRDWLVQHIRHTDRGYAEEFRAQKQEATEGSLARFFKRFMA